jgi:3-deoxy-7-phosphoheptulonate synthase
MRTYLEKPRSTVGWKGYVTDPALDGTCQMETGLQRARALLHYINAHGLPCATESLDPMLVPYTEDLVSWTALGARTAESQVHRAMASGLAMPVGIKNGTDGCVATAVDGIEAIASQHTYVAVADHGGLAMTRSNGNAHTHVVLRGGRDGPNFDAGSVADCESALSRRQMRANIMVDCSHANANKMHERQLDVLEEVSRQLCAGNHSLMGVMLESFLFPGNQPATRPVEARSYGVSVTDPCLGWGDTERALRELRKAIKPALEMRASSPQRAVA